MTLDVDNNGAGTVVRQESDIDHLLVLFVRERDLAAAVPAIGKSCRDGLWPDSSIDAAGFNLLLVHLDEVMATRHTPNRSASPTRAWSGRRIGARRSRACRPPPA